MKLKHIITTIAFSLIFSFSHIVLAQSDYKVAEQDSLALVAFYNATEGPNWISNQDGFGIEDLTSEWQETYTGGFNKWFDGPVKDWFGVTVEKLPIPNTNDSAYRVVQVWPVIGRRTDGQNNLNGYIPREVGLLTALSDFRINGNNGFTGTEIPGDLYHKNLRFFDIEACWFDGDITDEFRNCTQIGKMNFRYNYIDYMPTLDFLDEEALYNMLGTQWFYSTELSLAIFEKTIDYFYTISDNPKEFTIEMRDVTNVGIEREIVAPVGTSVEMECTAAGNKEEFITYQWLKDGLSRFGKTDRFYSISSVKESDYGTYTVRITNDYVKEYDENTNWGEVYTKPIHLVPEPVPPVIEWVKTSYNGKELQLRFSKPMDTNIQGFSNFSVVAGGNSLQVVAARTEGRLQKDVFLTLEGNVNAGEEVTLGYTGNSVVDQNTGALESFSGFAVENLVRPAANVVEARTTKDGSGIEVVFDNFIDPNSINAADFSINAEKDYTITSGVLRSGDIDENISKVVLLTLSQAVTDTSEVISVSYSKGKLSGLYSGFPESFTNKSVSNEVTLDLTEVTLYFEDGSSSMENVLVKGTWSVNPTRLYDDGTNGDEVAGDNIWSVRLSLVDNDYVWNVISRNIVQSYDTTSVTDPETGIITQTITPVSVNQDSVLSNNIVLEFQVGGNNVSGTTSFGINNVSVTFNVTLNIPAGEIFLMGIDGDWALGNPMNQVDNSNTYTVTLSGYTVGDVINYNFRNGDDWENQSTATRTYTVVEGENIINNHFGVFTRVNEFDSSTVKIYPNPASNILTISGISNIISLEVHNIYGQFIYKKSITSENSLILQISDFKPGVYFLKMTDESRNVFTEKFIKTN
jgi:hypothetical protein